jgi:hypothetical protein
MLRLAAVLLILSTLPLAAMDLKVEDSTVVMSGAVVGTECDALANLVAQSFIGTPIRTVVLAHSGGGDPPTGYCVGALIRKNALSTVIRGRCASACSRMWLGGVERSLDGPGAKVGVHGNYDSHGLIPDSPARLRAWIPQYAPAVDRALMEKWINLPSNTTIMYFYNDKAELCEGQTCTPLEGRTALSVGLATR